MPSTVPISCDMKLTPPSPPRDALPKMPAASPPNAPHKPCKRPHAEHVVDLPAILGQGEHPDEQATSQAASDQCAQRVHEIGAGANGDQSSQRAVMHEAGVIAPGDECGQGAANHGHQRVHGNQAADLVQRLGAHHVETEPADGEYPGPQREEGNARWRVGRDGLPSLW
jgi:hypothetical protein